MKVQETKTKNIGNTQNIKPYVVVGVGVLVIAVSVYQLIVGAPGNLFQSRLDSKATQEAAHPGSTKQDQQSLIVDNIDSDSDGLTDTEEERIYHTDPLKPDTDSDGYKDGDEVKTGHDPLASENGTATNGSQSSSATYGQQYNRFIATTPDDLSNIDPTKYLNDQNAQGGSTTYGQSIEKLSSLALANTAINQQTALPNIPDSQLIITSASGKQAVQQYLFAMGSLMLQGAPFGNQQQLTSYFLAAINGDTAKVQQLVDLAKKTEASLKKVPVPQEMVEIDKKALGILEVFQQSSSVLLNSNSVDATAGLTATNQLRIITNAVSDLESDMASIIKKYGINFTL
jgi:hypothetical protein